MLYVFINYYKVRSKAIVDARAKHPAKEKKGKIVSKNCLVSKIFRIIEKKILNIIRLNPTHECPVKG